MSTDAPHEENFESELVEGDGPAVDTFGTTVPRHLAGLVDNVVAMMLSVVCAKALPNSMPLLQGVVVFAVYLVYFAFLELVFSTTPGKLMNGLVNRDFSGGRCSARQTMIRTLFRLLEVNPLLFGFLPAAASIIWSRNHQRFGDKVAGTVVVFR
ncbi:RDD family protein [Posidoniimonas polymericola]|uniref:RDD family protein n=1 Tax=Posidoniimonas polymericola TaxID=2528002 RepID=A0A5C5YL42_9BACT|nr:RDD family protein [Posidoniimonas polymericola]TWT75564.1 RDD family protein [Posidoniimonas polymericola]